MIAPKTKTVGAYEAKTKLPSLLRQVARGREIIITNRDRPIAKLVPVHSGQQFSKDEICDQILAFHGRIKLPKGETGRDLALAGRK